MKIASLLAGALGLLVIVLAFYGRFHEAPTITFRGDVFSASGLLLAGNALLVIGVFLSVLGLQSKKE